MYIDMERVLKGDAKAKLTQQANLVGSCTVGSFTIVMATMTAHVSCNGLSRPETVHVWVPKETQDNESTHFHYQAHTAK